MMIVTWISLKRWQGQLSQQKKAYQMSTLDFQVNGKDIKCLFQGWEMHETMFPIVANFAYQILKIVES